MTSSARPRQPQGPSRRNHYIPEWYQAGFGVGGANNWFLDLSPASCRPDGTPIVRLPRQDSPKACFWEKDLYITRFGEQINDQIETVLFQGIDDFGAMAVRTFLGGDLVEMHDQHQALFAYLGAQKLRTPKGLDWIRRRYPALSQLELMVELQHLRQMFGTLWAESVREIVSAEDSAVKFIVSDHPVTVFNAALPDDAPQWRYPHDAPITWNGSQTVFALDANHLLILTHVPYAKTPAAVEPTAKRINARFFGDAMIKADALIQGRRLDTKDVLAINHWLKSRARRYIAAGDRAWLYPELVGPMDRARLAQALRPPEDELWQFGGELYIGYKDGTAAYRDQYGRTSKEHEFVEKVTPAAPPAAGAACPCGSGETYGVCCLRRAPWERPPWNVLSLRERNLTFIRALVGILELGDDRPWSAIQRGLSDEQVTRVHQMTQWLWPEGADLAELLPRPAADRTRAVYMGPSDPRTMARSVISLVPLFDQVLVMDPFLNPRFIQPKYSPVTAPTQYKLQFLKNVLFWLTLAPLIDAGKVVLFPDPGDMNPAFQRAMRTMALQRTANWQMDPKELEEFRGFGRDDFQRSLLLLPDEVLRSVIKQSSSELSEVEIQGAISALRREGDDDPFALLQTLPLGEKGAQLFGLRCVNLEVALFIALTTGAVIVTDIKALWEHLHLHTHAAQAATAATFQSEALHFRAPMHPDNALRVAASQAAAGVRDALHALQVVSESQGDAPRNTDVLKQCLQRLSETVVAGLHIDLHAPSTLTPSMPSTGFQSPTAQRLLVGFGRDDASVFLGLAFFRESHYDPAVSPVDESDK